MKNFLPLSIREQVFLTCQYCSKMWNVERENFGKETSGCGDQREIPGGAVVRTQRFHHCCGPSSVPSRETKILQAVLHSTRPPPKKREEERKETRHGQSSLWA